MTNEQNHAKASENARAHGANPWNMRDYLGWARTPGFNPLKAVAVVAGFAIFPPLGAAVLLYFVLHHFFWKVRRGHFGESGPAFAMGGGCGHGGRGRWTGNAAFDQHQAEVMESLRAERQAFQAYRAEVRRKRDQEAYDAFRNGTAGNAGDGTKAE